MTRRTTWLCVLMAAGTWLLPAQALCDGYGYYSWSRGWPRVGVPDFLLKEQLPFYQDLYGDVKVDLCYDHFSFGFLHDGASTTEQRFGWRFNLGVDIALVSLQDTNAFTFFGRNIEDQASRLFDAVGVGFTTKVTYGIGIYHTDRLRFWAGPAAALTANYLFQKTTSIRVGQILYEVSPWGASISLGGGVETGLRYEVSREVTLDFSTGFLYNFFGYYQDARIKVNSQPLPSDPSFLIGQEPYVFVQMAVRFDFRMPGY